MSECPIRSPSSNLCRPEKTLLLQQSILTQPTTCLWVAAPAQTPTQAVAAVAATAAAAAAAATVVAMHLGVEATAVAAATIVAATAVVAASSGL